MAMSCAFCPCANLIVYIHSEVRLVRDFSYVFVQCASYNDLNWNLSVSAAEKIFKCWYIKFFSDISLMLVGKSERPISKWLAGEPLAWASLVFADKSTHGKRRYINYSSAEPEGNQLYRYRKIIFLLLKLWSDCVRLTVRVNPKLQLLQGFMLMFGLSLYFNPIVIP